MGIRSEKKGQVLTIRFFLTRRVRTVADRRQTRVTLINLESWRTPVNQFLEEIGDFLLDSQVIIFQFHINRLGLRLSE